MANFNHERSVVTMGYASVCGVDEVGRGCLAGPLVAGAVVFDIVDSEWITSCLLYTSPSPRDGLLSRMPSSA